MTLPPFLLPHVINFSHLVQVRTLLSLALGGSTSSRFLPPPRPSFPVKEEGGLKDIAFDRFENHSWFPRSPDLQPIPEIVKFKCRILGDLHRTREESGLMGCVCCCLRANNLEEREYPTGRCICLEHLTQLVEDLYHSLFPRRERIAPSDEQGTATLAPTSSVQVNARLDSDFSFPRPLSYIDLRCSQSQCQNDGFALGRAKRPTPLHEKSQLLRFENVRDTELTGRKENLNDSNYEGGSRTSYSESSLKQQSAEMTSGVTYLYSASEDEDVCPICLEEYTSENPRIALQCAHQYHLSCIYEWMERSETCPVCSKMMLFSEDT